MESLCKSFNIISVKDSDDEYSYLEEIINESENVKIENLNLFLEKVYWLFKRYTVSWLDDSGTYPEVIKGINLYIQSWENKNMYNINNIGI